MSTKSILCAWAFETDKILGSDTMLKKSMMATALLAGSLTPAFAQESIGLAIAAAMGETIEDPRYIDVIEKYSLPIPVLSENPLMATTKNTSYPEVEAGTLLDQVIQRKTLRIGYVGIGVPWSVTNPDGGDPTGLSIDFWKVALDKLSAQYNTEIKAEYVEFNSQIGNNNMYQWLASDNDKDCVNLDLPSPESCYDVIGGAYAINERRKKVSAMTPAYYPLNLSAVRTLTPLNKDIPLDTAEEILAAAADIENGLIFATLPDTGESAFLKLVMEETGETFSIITRPPTSNVLEYAETTPAHFVIGTNVRMAVTRTRTPEFCSDCEVIPNILRFDGVGFATAATE